MKYSILITYILLILSIFSCSESKKENFDIEGKTMGTYYLVKIVGSPKGLTLKEIKKEIEITLININQKLSNWDILSEISVLNKNKSHRPIKISKDLSNVINAANAINIKSHGFLDITIDPLIELWGFGYKNKKQNVPTNIEIENALKFVNQKKLIQLDFKNNMITKVQKDVSINLSSIAKGYGIDMIGKKLKNLGITNYLIDIGGDILTHGVNSKYQNWVIGIENPNLKKKLIKEIVNVSNKGVATSGDYKNYYKENGKQYSHIINPKTGKPIEHLTKSVTVVHDNAMTADGWATALLAMGSLKGLKLAEEQNIAVLFISKQNKQMVKIKSSQFKKINEVNN